MIPNVKYNLLLDSTSAENYKIFSKMKFFIALLIIAIIGITFSLAYYYTVKNHRILEQEHIDKARVYAIDEYLHANFIGKKYDAEIQDNPNQQPKLVCYYGYPSSWNASTDLLPEHIDCNLCTHINIAFATLKNHTIELSDNLKLTLTNISKLRDCNKEIKLLLSIGGGGSENGFSDMVATHGTRKDFIKSLKNILRQYNLDGVDLDWEFPSIRIEKDSETDEVNVVSDPRERQHFSQLLREIRTEFIREKRDYLLTVAVAAPEFIVDSAYDVNELNLYVDFVNVMSYDFHYYTPYTPFTGFNSPLYSMKQDSLYLKSLNINYTSHMWVSKGMDLNKVVVGLPIYGHSFTLVNSENILPGGPAKGFGKLGSLGFVLYKDVCNFLEANSDAVVVFNNETMSPYLYKGSEWISYENIDSIISKSLFIKKNKFGGAMVYSLNSDDFNGSCSVSNETFYLVRKVNSIVLDNEL